MSHHASSNSMRQIIALFREYYRKAQLILPKDYALREFAIQPFNSNTYIRHLAFNSVNELRKYILEKTPRHLYYSSAKYENPGLKDMESKKWLGSDLIFDIDVDHIPDCNSIEYWICPNKHVFTNEQIGDNGKCPICGESLEKTSIVTDECIIKGIGELRKLVDILIEDFGFTKNKIKAYFSGHRGFHVHVELDEQDSIMDSNIRREIVDYILGLGIDLYQLKLVDEKIGRTKRYALLPRIDDYGWRRRIAKAIIEYGKDLGVKDDAINYILGKLQPTMSHTLNSAGVAPESLVDSAKVLVDEKVTIDIHRLIRIPGSINGKTGLIVTELKSIENFKLTPKLSPFKGYAILKPFTDLKNLNIMSMKIDFRKDTSVKIELPIAIYIHLKGLGEIIRII